MNLVKKLGVKRKRDGLLKTALAVLRHLYLLKRQFVHKRTLKSALEKSSLSERFSRIHEKNLWESKESDSGPGSEIAYTEGLRAWLIDNLPRLHIKRLVDVPCGDFNWMKLVLPRVNVDYFGFDIVAELIQKNQTLYGAERVQFGVANICEDTLPHCDILMVRDCLFHLSYADINKFLDNISGLEYRYLLTTTHLVESGFANKDIVSGDHRALDLFAHPFNFNEKFVIDRVNDFPVGHPAPRQMVLMKKAHVPTSIAVSALIHAAPPPPAEPEYGLIGTAYPSAFALCAG